MQKLFTEIKQIGVRGALSNLIVDKVYGTRGKLAIAKGNLNAARIRRKYGCEEAFESKEIENLLEEGGGVDVSDSGSN